MLLLLRFPPQRKLSPTDNHLVGRQTHQLTVQNDVPPVASTVALFFDDVRLTASNCMPVCLGFGAGGGAINEGVFTTTGLNGLNCFADAFVLPSEVEAFDDTPRPKHLPDRKSSRFTAYSTSSSLLPTEKLTPSLIRCVPSIPCAFPLINLKQRLSIQIACISDQYYTLCHPYHTACTRRRRRPIPRRPPNACSSRKTNWAP